MRFISKLIYLPTFFYLYVHQITFKSVVCAHCFFESQLNYYFFLLSNKLIFIEKLLPCDFNVYK